MSSLLVLKLYIFSCIVFHSEWLFVLFNDDDDGDDDDDDDDDDEVTGQNGSGQNGTDKMVWTKWYMDKMVQFYILCTP